jgi:hypothetical protein
LWQPPTSCPCNSKELYGTCRLMIYRKTMRMSRLMINHSEEMALMEGLIVKIKRMKAIKSLPCGWISLKEIS